MSSLQKMHAMRELAFGFVPAQVVTDLKDIGNWKVKGILARIKNHLRHLFV